MKKIRILVLAVIMAVAVMPGSVFAGEISDSTDDGIRAVSAATDDLSQNRAVYGNIGYVTMTTGVEPSFNDQVGVVTYGAGGGCNAVNGAYGGVSRKITVPAKGTVNMAVNGTCSIGSGDIYYGVFMDQNMTQPVNDSSYNVISAGSGKAEGDAFSVPAGGTYYVGVYSDISSGQDYTVVSLAAYASGADRTLSGGQWSAVGQKEEQTNLFRFKASSTGYIRVDTTDVDDDSSVSVTLLSSRKALSSTADSASKPVYGVKKGVTYYIRARAGYSRGGGYRLKVTNHKISEKSGSSRSKAVNIKRDSTVKGTVIAGESRSDWYKFKLSGKKSVSLTVKGATNDRLKIEVYSGRKKVKTSTFYSSTESLTLRSAGKWKKGTYHIKVYRGNSRSSGWYSLKWR